MASVSTEKYPICGMIMSLQWKTIQHFTPVIKAFFSRWSPRMLLRGKTGQVKRQWALWISGGRLLPWTPHEKQKKMHHKQCMEQNLIWRMRNETILSPWRLLSPLNRYSALQEIWFQWKRVGKLTMILLICAFHTWSSLPKLICIKEQRPNLYYPIQSNRIQCLNPDAVTIMSLWCRCNVSFVCFQIVLKVLCWMKTPFLYQKNTSWAWSLIQN